MDVYNRIMLYFWLSVTIISGVTITYMSFREGFDHWYPYYIVPSVSLMMYIVRKWMMKRMQKHLKYLEEKNKTGK